MSLYYKVSLIFVVFNTGDEKINNNSDNCHRLTFTVTKLRFFQVALRINNTRILLPQQLLQTMTNASLHSCSPTMKQKGLMIEANAIAAHSL